MTRRIELTPHVEDIARALDGKLPYEQIESELKEYTDVYQLPLYEAKRNLVKKYGGNLSLLQASEEKKISEITVMDKLVDVIGLVRSINTKEAKIKGELRTLFYGLLIGEDGTSIPFTAWDDPRIEKGQLIKIRNARVSSWRERPQLTISGPQQIKILNFEDFPQFRPENIRNEQKISDVTVGDSFIVLKGLVLEAEKMERERDDGTKAVFYRGSIGDETGFITFTSWKDTPIEKGDFLVVENAYARERLGLPSLVFNENTRIRKEDAPKDFPTAEEIMKPKWTTLAELEKQGGGNNVMVTGVLLDIKKNSGLILRCPQCNKVIQKGGCSHHDDVDGIPDLRIKGVFDDGESAISVVINRELTEKLLGMSLEECEELARKKMDNSIIQQKLEEKLLTRTLTLYGNVIKDDYGLTLIAKDVSTEEIDIISKAEELLRSLEEVKE